MTDLEKRIAEIQARAQKATPGPWLHDWVREASQSAEWATQFVLLGDRPESRYTWQTRIPYTKEEYQRDYDAAEFIAHARTDIPFLIAELRKVAADRDRLIEWQSVTLEIAERNEETLAELIDAKDRAEKPQVELKKARAIMERQREALQLIASDSNCGHACAYNALADCEKLERGE